MRSFIFIAVFGASIASAMGLFNGPILGVVIFGGLFLIMLIDFAINIRKYLSVKKTTLTSAKVISVYNTEGEAFSYKIMVEFIHPVGQNTMQMEFPLLLTKRPAIGDIIELAVNKEDTRKSVFASSYGAGFRIAMVLNFLVMVYVGYWMTRYW